MALDHTKPGQPVDIGPLGTALRESATHAILKTRSLEVIRLVLQDGQTLPSHAMRGESTLLCIEGAAEVTVDGTACLLRANQFVLLPAQAAHTIQSAGRHLAAMDHPTAGRRARQCVGHELNSDLGGAEHARCS